MTNYEVTLDGHTLSRKSNNYYGAVWAITRNNIVEFKGFSRDFRLASKTAINQKNQASGRINYNRMYDPNNKDYKYCKGKPEEKNDRFNAIIKLEKELKIHVAII